MPSARRPTEIGVAGFDHLSEIYRIGDSILSVVMNPKDGSRPRTYRLFAMRHETPPMGAPAEYFSVDVDEAMPIKESGAADAWTWCRLIIAGVDEGTSPEDALQNALRSLNAIANGDEWDERTKSFIGGR